MDNSFAKASVAGDGRRTAEAAGTAVAARDTINNSNVDVVSAAGKCSDWGRSGERGGVDGDRSDGGGGGDRGLGWERQRYGGEHSMGKMVGEDSEDSGEVYNVNASLSTASAMKATPTAASQLGAAPSSFMSRLHQQQQQQQPWYKHRHLLRLNILILSVIQLSSTNGYDGSLLNGLQALPQWQSFMRHPTGVWLGFIIAMQSIGQLSMYPFCSWLVQRHGRKAGVYLGYLWLGIAVAVQVSARNVASFIVARFFVGAATAMWFGSVPLLVAEVAHPAHRGVCSSLWNCGWFVGATLAAWVTYGTRGYVSSWAWRVPSLLQLALPLVALPGVVWLPESPRWLMARGRRDEARNVLMKWHAGVDGRRINTGEIDFIDAEVKVELAEIEGALKREKEEGLTNGFDRGYLQLMSGKGNRWRSFVTVTVGVLAQWNGVGIVQYYLVLVLETVGITGVTEQTLISGFLQVWNLICSVTGALLVNRVGRRKLFNISNVAMTVCFILITALSGTFANQGNSAAGIAVIPFLFLYYGAYDVAWNPLIFSYTVEIWPYSLRAKGLSMCLISTALALLFNIFVNPIALANIGWRYYIVYVVILMVATLICWLFYPETRGYTLEQIAVVFDGEKAVLTLEDENSFNAEDVGTEVDSEQSVAHIRNHVSGGETT